MLSGCEAIKHADKIKSFGPLVEYLRRPGIQWGLAEYWWLQSCSSRCNIPSTISPARARRSGRKSREAELKRGVAYYDKRRDEGRSSEEALDDAAADTCPRRFGAGEDGRANLSAAWPPSSSADAAKGKNRTVFVTVAVVVASSHLALVQLCSRAEGHTRHEKSRSPLGT